MRNLVTSNTRLAWPRAMRFAGVVAGLSIVGLRAARAQAVSGSVDPSTGLGTLAPYLLGIAATGIVIVAMWRGGVAVAEGRSLGPTIAGFIGGMVICFGGYYIMQHYGVTTT